MMTMAHYQQLQADERAISNLKCNIRKLLTCTIKCKVQYSTLGNQMKRLVMLTGFLAVGIVTAIAVMTIVDAFDDNPGCGLDCVTPDGTVAWLSGITTMFAFPILGFIFTRGKNFTMRRVLMVLMLLIAIALFAASCRYIFELHKH
jgi:hypothetical protein